MPPRRAAAADASSSDDEGGARRPQSPPRASVAAPPPRSFDELLQQASELKACQARAQRGCTCAVCTRLGVFAPLTACRDATKQLREKRRAFEEAPSFFQYTLARAPCAPLRCRWR